MASQSPSQARMVLVVGIWFGFNISMASLTKWTFLYAQVCDIGGSNCRTFQFPFMITVVHMLFSWTGCLFVYRTQGSKPVRVRLSLVQQLQKIVPVASCFAISVAMGNLSLKYIYPSFSQMLSSVSPLVTVLVAMAIRRKTYNVWTWISMPVICGGLLVCSTAEINFNLRGATLVVSATVLRALKSVMQEKLLDPKEKDMDSVSLLFYLAPWAGLFLMIMSLWFEGLEPLRMLCPWINDVPTTGVLNILVLLSFSGVNACFLNLSGNQVTAYVGAVGLQILGNLKACMSIVVSVAIFRNPVTPLQCGGVIMCLFGVWLYSSWGGPAKTIEASR